ncbi:AAA family ATPase [Kocuria sp. UBA5001]|uniref:AAA family ATPase n=1 Tax=Kocuria sp. UBA5001 TaxID=1946674 RepID=UPI0025C27E74|nr:SMC family ATPase [Kocuria sp. UBA5001]
MKLHRLEITAFGPFPQHETVDFDALNEAGVFLLNGETGAGKTSVLDAVCFALYGSGPTTVGKGGRKVQHSHHAEPHTAPRVEVEFTASGRRWCVTRTPAWREPSTRAASGWRDRHATVLLREYTEGQWADRGHRPDDVGQAIHHAVGLNREQFTQVMMLPQGKFAQFLQAGSREREELLETLFGTDVYADVQEELKARADAAKTDAASAQLEWERSEELLSRAGERLSRLNEQDPRTGLPARGSVPSPADSADGVRSASEEDSPDDGGDDEVSGGETSPPEGPASLSERWHALVSDGESALAGAVAARDEAADRHASSQQRITELEALSGLLARFDRLTVRRAELRAQSQRLGDARRRLEEHTAAEGLAEPLASAIRARRRVADSASAVEAVRAALTETSAAARSLRDVLRDRPDLVRELEGTPEMPRQLRDAAVTAREAARGTAERARLLAEEETALQRDEESLRTLELRSEEIAAELTARHADLARWEDSRQELELQVKDEGLVRERARAAREAVEASRDYARARDTENARAAEFESAETARREAARQVESLETLRYAGAASSLARELSEGDPCPVCGSTVHPCPATGDEEQDVTPGMLQRAREDRETAQNTADAAHHRWQQAQRTSAEHLARGAGEDLADVVERARLARLAEEAVESALAELQRGTEEIATVHDTVTRLETEERNTTTQMAGVRTGVEAARGRCASERERVARAIGPFATVQDCVRAAEELVQLTTRWSDAQDERDAARHEKRTAEEALDRALARSPFSREVDVHAALMDEEEATEVTDWVERVASEVAALDAELATQDMQRAARLTEQQRHEVSAEARERAQAECEEAARHRDALNRLLGGLEDLTVEARSHAREAPARETALQAARDRAERLSGLAGVATATTSENSLRMTLTSFVLAARLEHVAAVASEHLSTMSSGRFALVHTDQTRGSGKSGLGLEIEDAWTGARRGTETLSGGESFFTSLALALALADVVRADAGGTEIDTLFVDEGFGSLDEQTLEQVLETLDGLRRGGRVIGVVSHVSEMKQRIETQLVVTKTPRGSHLRVETGSAVLT